VDYVVEEISEFLGFADWHGTILATLVSAVATGRCVVPLVGVEDVDREG
jgi:hypothetical protein